MKQWNTIKKLKVIPYKVFSGDVETVEDILEEIKWTDTEFKYKSKPMFLSSEYQGDNANPRYKYVIADNSDKMSHEEYLKTRHEYSSMEELILNYKFDDGVSFIDFLTKEYIWFAKQQSKKQR